MRVLVAAGGTAGHISPALALARELAEGHEADVRFAGSPRGQEATAVPAAGFAFEPIDATPLVRGLSVRNVTAPAMVLRSAARARPLVEDADVVVGMGGYVSVPVAIATLRARRPLVLHEQNAVPGLANRVFARPARRVALSFADAARRLPRRTRTVVTGNPVRAAILDVRSERERLAREGRELLGLEPDRRTVMVFGGSQGARRLNTASAGAVAALGERGDLQMLLVTGAAHLDAVREALPSETAILVRALPFLDRMELAYAVADLLVCRAGASTVAELAVCGLPSLLVPYPYATARHQDANADALARAGAAVVVPDDALTGALLASRVSELLADGGRLRTMGERAAAWARPDAARALSSVVVEVAA